MRKSFTEMSPSSATNNVYQIYKQCTYEFAIRRNHIANGDNILARHYSINRKGRVDFKQRLTDKINFAGRVIIQMNSIRALIADKSTIILHTQMEECANKYEDFLIDDLIILFLLIVVVFGIWLAVNPSSPQF